jgi:hypothetical protein
MEKSIVMTTFEVYLDDFIKTMRLRDSQIHVNSVRVAWYFNAKIPISQAVESYIDWLLRS